MTQKWKLVLDEANKLEYLHVQITSKQLWPENEVNRLHIVCSMFEYFPLFHSMITKIFFYRSKETKYK